MLYNFIIINYYAVLLLTNWPLVERSTSKHEFYRHFMICLVKIIILLHFRIKSKRNKQKYRKLRFVNFENRIFPKQYLCNNFQDKSLTSLTNSITRINTKQIIVYVYKYH